MVMFQNKLKALGYIFWDKVDRNDEEHFRKLVTWLEDQKIRHYRIEDRKDLNATYSNDWSKTFDKYCNDVQCPVTTSDLDKLEWLVGLAVRLEYEDNLDKYKAVKSKKQTQMATAAPSIKSQNPLDSLDFESKDFKDGVDQLAKLLQIPRHPNHLITLEACAKFINKRLNPNAVQYPDTVIVRGKPFPIMEMNFGSNLGSDPVLNKAAKILHLLYTHDLRDLQTKINEIIVSVQTITANPKTDTRLGKVGF